MAGPTARSAVPGRTFACRQPVGRLDGVRRRHPDVHHDDVGAQLRGERVDHRAAGQEVGDHLRRDLLRPRGDALGVHAVVGGEDGDGGRLGQRRAGRRRRCPASCAATSSSTPSEPGGLVIRSSRSRAARSAAASRGATAAIVSPSRVPANGVGSVLSGSPPGQRGAVRDVGDGLPRIAARSRANARRSPGPGRRPAGGRRPGPGRCRRGAPPSPARAAAARTRAPAGHPQQDERRPRRRRRPPRPAGSAASSAARCPVSSARGGVRPPRGRPGVRAGGRARPARGWRPASAAGRRRARRRRSAGPSA